MWRGGCIIRSRFLNQIKEAFKKQPNLSNLLLDSYFKNQIEQRIDNYRKVISLGVLSGIPMPSLSSGLSYFDGYTTKKLPANLLQAMRDYFGAHTYERLDSPRGTTFHTNWTGTGGSTSSTTYDA
jgi:6-phosphogluconate dehydrogenase